MKGKIQQQQQQRQQKRTNFFPFSRTRYLPGPLFAILHHPGNVPTSMNHRINAHKCILYTKQSKCKNYTGLSLSLLYSSAIQTALWNTVQYAQCKMVPFLKYLDLVICHCKVNLLCKFEFNNLIFQINDSYIKSLLIFITNTLYNLLM